jgi:hypothetical protein
VIANVIASPEFYSSQGGTNQAFINAVYQDLLGRTPDASESAYWLTQLNAAGPIACLQAANAFLQSPEALQKLFDGNYRASQGGTPMVSADQPARGAYALARATGNGFGALYLNGNADPALQSAFLADMSGGVSDAEALTARCATRPRRSTSDAERSRGPSDDLRLWLQRVITRALLLTPSTAAFVSQRST